MRIERYIIIVSLSAFFIYVEREFFPIVGNYFFFLKDEIEIRAEGSAFYIKIEHGLCLFDGVLC